MAMLALPMSSFTVDASIREILKTLFQIALSDLVGKDILLYFSAHWCPPCRAFLPKLVQAYKEINEKHNNSLEVIFISSDRDQSSFDEFFSAMPWLALPFGDGRKKSLSRFFKVNGIPTVVAIGPTGRTVTTEARDLIMRSWFEILSVHFRTCQGD